MLMAILVVAAVLFVGVVAVLRRKNEGATHFGEPGAQAVKLGRLY
jgi:hypothetical protein